MYKLDLVGIYEIGFLKADLYHVPDFITTIKLLLRRTLVLSVILLYNLNQL